MNRQFIFGAVILACLCLSVSQSYAWNQPPVAVIDGSYYKYAHVGTPKEFTDYDSYDPDGYIVWHGWDFPGIFYGTSEPSITHTFDSCGVYYVYLRVQDNEGMLSYYDDSCKVYVVDVDFSGGGYVALNNVAEISLGFDPSYPTLNSGKARLEAVSGGNKITVWYEQTKETQVTLPKEWLFSRLPPPQTLWVEGIETSSSLNDVQLKLSFIDPYTSETIDDDTTEFTVVNVEITKPNGDPTTTEGANDTNERAFSASSSGVLTVECEATPNPDTTEIRDYLNNNRVKWTVQAIGGSALSWNFSWPGENAKGEGLSCTATFTGLPTSNSDFGLKQVKMELLLDGTTVDLTDTTNIEVFYPKTATNNPDGTVPNWFYYWQEGEVVLQLDNFEYEPGDGCGHFYPPDTLVVHDGAAEGWEAVEGTFYNHRYQTSINTGESGYANTPTGGLDQKKFNIVLPFEDPAHDNQKVYCDPYSVAITAGNNGVIDTVAQGDNGIEYREGEGEVLHTGWRGRLSGSTTPAPDDEWKYYEYMDRQAHIQPGLGRPWSISITLKNYDWMTIEPAPDDEIDLSGADDETWSQPACTGIDSCAITCKHERNHQDMYNMLVNDSDLDDVDDDYEVNCGYHLCPFHGDTYNFLIDFWALIGETPPGGWNPELEFLAYMAEQNPGPTDPSKDWSDTDGKNWDQ
jgi:hypothetical protein